MSNLKNVAQAFIQETVVESLKAVHLSAINFGKDVLKVGTKFLEKSGEILSDALVIKWKVIDKTVEIAAQIGKGVADVGKGAYKMGEKAAQKTLEFAGDIGKGTLDVGKSALKMGGKAVDAVTDVAEEIYNKLKFW